MSKTDNRQLMSEEEGCCVVLLNEDLFIYFFGLVCL